MSDNLDQFLKKSPLANRIKLEGKVVVHRTRLRPRDIAGFRQQGFYQVQEAETCTLTIGSQIIASGKIIERDGEYYFVPSKNR